MRIVPTPGTTIELVMRHWSNAGLKLPNHGQDFATLTFTLSPDAMGRRFASAREKTDDEPRNQ